MKKFVMLAVMLAVVFTSGCSVWNKITKKPANTGALVDTGTVSETGSVATGAVTTGAEFDPEDFNDPEVNEILNLLEDLVAEE